MATDENFKTTDRQLVVTLLSMGYKYVKKAKDGARVCFYFDRGTIKDIVTLWQNNEPIPVKDIRDIFTAEVIFNSAVHDEI